MTALLKPLHILDTRYTDRSACKGLDPELFVSQHSHDYVKKICATCPVAANCFFEAVGSDVEGTWGGVYFPSGRTSGGRRRRSVDPRDRLVAQYRAALAAVMGLTRTQFVTRYGESIDAMRAALEDTR